MSGTPSGPSWTSPPIEVFGRLHGAFVRHQARCARLLGQHGLNLASFDILAALRRAGPPYRRTLGKLATSSMISAGGATMRADQLEQAGMVVRERDQADRRIVCLRLTAAGRALVDAAADEHFADGLESLSCLIGDQQRRLAGLLRALEFAQGG